MYVSWPGPSGQSTVTSVHNAAYVFPPTPTATFSILCRPRVAGPSRVSEDIDNG